MTTDLRELAKTSPTAKNLLDIILKEDDEAKKQEELERLEREEVLRRQRLEQIRHLAQRTKDFLGEYEKHRQLAQDALHAAYRESRRLPHDIGNNPFSPHLLYAHLPPVHQGPMEPLRPAFTTTQCFAEELNARGTR